MPRLPRLTGFLLVGFLLSFGLVAHAGEPEPIGNPDMHPVVFTHTSTTETTELVIFTKADALDLLTTFLQTYGFNQPIPQSIQELPDQTSPQNKKPSDLHIKNNHTESDIPQDAGGTGGGVFTGTDGTRGADGEQSGTSGDVLDTLRLSEIYANTTGGDLQEEYIELVNTGEQAISVRGWTIIDASGKSFTLQNEDTVQSGEHYVVTRPDSNISLNNNEETLTLKSPLGTNVDTLSYTNAVKGSSFATLDGAWSWTDIRTPGQPNQLPIPAVSSTESSTDSPEPAHAVESATDVLDQTIQQPTESTPTPTPSSTPTNTNPIVSDVSTTPPVNPQITSQDILSLPDGARVDVDATVLVAPGVLGKQIFYVTTDTQAVQVYKNDSVFPEIDKGQRVHISGELSTSKGERRVKIPKDGAIEPKDIFVEIHPTSLAIQNLTNEYSGWLVQTNGTVISKSNSSLTIEDAGQQVEISISGYAQIDTTPFVSGARVSVTGILVAQEESIKIKPRSQDDIQLIEQTVVAAGLREPSGKEQQIASEKKTAILLSAGTVLIVAILLWRRYRPVIKPSYVKHTPLATSTPDLR